MSSIEDEFPEKDLSVGLGCILDESNPSSQLISEEIDCWAIYIIHFDGYETIAYPL
jgi:hypothetical protein